MLIYHLYWTQISNCLLSSICKPSFPRRNPTTGLDVAVYEITHVCAELILTSQKLFQTFTFVIRSHCAITTDKTSPDIRTTTRFIIDHYIYYIFNLTLVNGLTTSSLVKSAKSIYALKICRVSTNKLSSQLTTCANKNLPHIASISQFKLRLLQDLGSQNAYWLYCLQLETPLTKTSGCWPVEFIFGTDPRLGTSEKMTIQVIWNHAPQSSHVLKKSPLQPPLPPKLICMSFHISELANTQRKPL